MRLLFLAAALAVACSSREARAQSQGFDACSQTAEGFRDWAAAFRAHAVEQGISPRTVQGALLGVSYDPAVIRLDRSQKPFKLTFEKFAAQRVTKGRLRQGRELLQHYRAQLAAIETRFGVPPEVVVAIWGLETDYGVNVGDRPVFRSLATLAFDCRRAERFRGELLSALRIVDRGDMTIDAMRGAWAGELGQTQFLASSYEKFAVDFDGDQRADLVSSPVDVLASTANYLAQHGWRPGGDWSPGTANFEVIATWNKSLIYQKTIALFATRLARP